MNNYLSPKEFQVLMKDVTVSFPEVVRTLQVGTTYQQYNIPGYILAIGVDPAKAPFHQKNIVSRPAILIDGMHHSNELSTLTQ